MTTAKKPSADAARPGKKISGLRRRAATSSKPGTSADDPKTRANQPVETVPIAVDVPKGMVLMTVTPSEAAELERSRRLASENRLFRLIPRDWTTPLALLVPLVAVLVTDISDQGVYIGFVVATVLACIWLGLSLIGRAVYALKTRSANQRLSPVLKDS